MDTAKFMETLQSEAQDLFTDPDFSGTAFDAAQAALDLAHTQMPQADFFAATDHFGGQFETVKVVEATL